MTPGFKFLGTVFVVLLLTIVGMRAAHACTADDEDPADNEWSIQCSISRT